MSLPALNLADFDASIRPQDDLFRHANGAWLESTPIPDHLPSYGSFLELREAAEWAVNDIITHLAPDDDPASEASKIAHLYATFLDEARIEELGGAPLAPVLERIDDIVDRADLSDYFGWAARHGLGSIIDMGPDADAGDPSRYVWFMTQSGLGLPDEEYYRLDEHAEIRESYRAHIARTLALSGIGETESRKQARAVLALETAIAACHWDKVRCRDLNQMYCPQTWDEFTAGAPGILWEALREAAGIAAEALTEVVNAQRTYPAGVAALAASEPLATWRAWARWHAISALSPYLSDAFVQERFDFYGRTLSGTPELKARWKRGVALVEAVMGEAIGARYVATHFPPAAKARADELVANLLEAYRRSITDLDWMSPATKQEALKKLDGFKPMIGYPLKWRDYSDLVVTPGDLVGCVLAADEFEFDYNLGKLSRPLDREEWEMTPQTVNAYYHPLRNVIVFPAAILQPPFFNPEADDAVNYGGIGAVIGHEIGHGFDDQGSATDAEGRLRDWWTEADRAAFEERTAALVGQYDALSPVAAPEVHVNGRLTLGENIGDLGGLSIAYLAWQISREASAASEEPIDGYTPAQRLFLGYGACWQRKSRPEFARQMAAIDPHSPDEHRANQVPKNIPAFHEAFGTVPGDGMWLDPSQRVKIW